MEELMNVHPGEILKEEFLDPLNITPYRLSKSIKVQQIHISRIIKGELGISADIALRLSKFFGNSAEFWMNLNRNHELRKIRHQNIDLLESIKSYEEDIKI
ncbi:MAG: HigA family addiction module antitoxin [Bacteroidota bacterium]